MRDPSFRGLKIKDDDFFSLSQWILGVFADQGAIDWNVRFAFENGHPTPRIALLLGGAAIFPLPDEAP